MRRSFILAFVFAGAACIEIPDNVRAQFARPTAAERSNYRKGPHGSALPVEDAELPAPKQAMNGADAGGGVVPSASSAEDAGSVAAPKADAEPKTDGGAR